MTKKPLNLICRPNWMVEELSKANRKVSHSLGFDIPDFSYNDIWWAPQEYMIHLNFSLMSKGRDPIKLFGSGMEQIIRSESSANALFYRDFTIFKASEIDKIEEEGFWKPLEAKIDKFPAKWRNPAEVKKDIADAKVNPDELLLFTPEYLSIAKEYRVFFYDGEPRTVSPYIDFQETKNPMGKTVYDGATAGNNELERVKSFAHVFIDRVTDILPAGVVDIAMLHGGSLCVLETNPAWCSAWYNCSVDEVCDTIQSGFEEASPSYLPSATTLDAVSRRSLLM